jgi:DNA-directed RNA polymerase subunit alpha
VFTVNDLLHCTREDLLSISNFGEKTLEEVYKALESVGFYRPHRRPKETTTVA